MKALIASCALVLAACASASAQPPARPTGDSALMPADNAVAGWKKADGPRVFTSADLYGYIDGGAELFLEMGFDQLTLQKYRNGAANVAVETYRMTDAAAATGIYLMKCGKETRDPQFKGRHTINRHQLMFVHERYYITVNNLSGADGMQPELVRFAAQLVSKLPADRLPSDLAILPKAGLVPGSERLIRGPFGLQALYTLGDGDILLLGGKTVAVAGDYRDATGNSTLILVNCADAASARKTLANVQQNLDKYLKAVSSSATRLVFKDYENKFGVLTLNGRQVEIRLHLAKPPI
jgi:hypothetical protein